MRHVVTVTDRIAIVVGTGIGSAKAGNNRGHAQIIDVQCVNLCIGATSNLLQFVVNKNAALIARWPARVRVFSAGVACGRQPHWLRFVSDVPQINGVDIEVDQYLTGVVALITLRRAIVSDQQAGRIVHVFATRRRRTGQLRAGRIRQTVSAPGAALDIAAGQI